MIRLSSARREIGKRAGRLALGLLVGASVAVAEDAGRWKALAATTVERVEVSYASPGRLWREAESFAAAQADCEVLVGRGDSMLPLFPDRTVIVVRRTPLAELQVGMTVVFFGDRGRPVAHTLVANSSGGWIARGLANDEVDRTRVRRNNYIGQVVRAYLPEVGGALAANLATDGPAIAGSVGQ
jgi:hypothetical protein